jgi:hypothetical protein
MENNLPGGPDISIESRVVDVESYTKSETVEATIATIQEKIGSVSLDEVKKVIMKLEVANLKNKERALAALNSSRDKLAGTLLVWKGWTKRTEPGDAALRDYGRACLALIADALRRVEAGETPVIPAVDKIPVIDQKVFVIQPTEEPVVPPVGKPAEEEKESEDILKKVKTEPEIQSTQQNLSSDQLIQNETKPNFVENKEVKKTLYAKMPYDTEMQFAPDEVEKTQNGENVYEIKEYADGTIGLGLSADPKVQRYAVLDWKFILARGCKLLNAVHKNCVIRVVKEGVLERQSDGTLKITHPPEIEFYDPNETAPQNSSTKEIEPLIETPQDRDPEYIKFEGLPKKEIPPPIKKGENPILSMETGMILHPNLSRQYMDYEETPETSRTANTKNNTEIVEVKAERDYGFTEEQLKQKIQEFEEKYGQTLAQRKRLLEKAKGYNDFYDLGKKKEKFYRPKDLKKEREIYLDFLSNSLKMIDSYAIRRMINNRATELETAQKALTSINELIETTKNGVEKWKNNPNAVKELQDRLIEYDKDVTKRKTTIREKTRELRSLKMRYAEKTLEEKYIRDLIERIKSEIDALK